MRALLLLVMISCGGSTTHPPPTIANRQTAEPAPRPVDRRFAMKVVDSTNVFMQRVYKDIGGAGGQRGSVSGSLERWADQTGGTYTDVYLVGPDRATLEAYFAGLGASALRIPEDREIGYERLPDGRWRTYLLERAAALDGAAIASATKLYDPNTSLPIVALDLTADGARKLKELTERIQGQKLAILVDGTVKSAPVIMAPITEGRASITMSGSDPDEQLREADALLEVFAKRSAVTQ